MIDLTLAPEPSAPRLARAATAASFAHLARCEDLLVCVSEAVSNAVLHAGTPMRFVVRDGSTVVRVEVSDDSPTLPVRRDPDPTTPTGRGLLLIDRLTSRWGIEGHDAGKTLWFEVPV